MAPDVSFLLGMERIVWARRRWTRRGGAHCNAKMVEVYFLGMHQRLLLMMILTFLRSTLIQEGIADVHHDLQGFCVIMIFISVVIPIIIVKTVVNVFSMAMDTNVNVIRLMLD